MSDGMNPAPAPRFAELGVASNFSFLRGASHAAELVVAARALGLEAIGIADRNTLAGIVRAHTAAKQHGIRLVVGARLVLQDGFETLCFPQDITAYARLTQMLTAGNRRAPKGECHLTLADLMEFGEGQNLIAMPPPPARLAEEAEALIPSGMDFEMVVTRLAARFPGQVFLAARHLYRGDDRARLAGLADMADRCGAPLVVTNDVLYHSPDRRPLQDILTCIRTHTTIDAAGFRLEANAERHLKSPAEMARLFKGFEDALARSIEITQRCRFSLEELRYQYPDEPAGDSASPQQELERLTWQGARNRFPGHVPEKVVSSIRHELELIAEKNYAPYFLTVYDIVRFARSLPDPILCQGRGSAANSVVCYCLGVTSVNPTEIDLLFERFISNDRDEPPDIDVDFEHARREEVIQYIYEKYGRHRAGIAATVITYRTRSAVREVGKAMGLSPDVVGALAEGVWGWSSKGVSQERVREAGLDPADPRLALALRLTTELIGFPRHLSQHVGGFVITRDRLDHLVPIANAAMQDRTYVEWDKDDLDALDMMKVDVLALGMLTCLKKAFDLMQDHYDLPLTLANVPREDPAVYDMMCAADTVGVFQIESRAQMSMLPRLRPREFYDLVIQIAIVRPGPIQGDMVHPYLRRRDGDEPVEYPSKELEAVLKKTFGVPLFQEQAMKIAIVGAGFSPARADGLRRAMASFRHTGTIGNFREDFIKGMIGNGYTPDFAERCFKQIEGFSDYGFPESHSASFAVLAYASSWIKCHYPDVFACAILNAQPLGFYSSSSLVRDFREHGGTTRPVDINLSNWDHRLEETANPRALTSMGGGAFALRLGLRQIKGLRSEAGERIEATRRKGFDSMRDFYFRTGLPIATIERLAEADAFNSIGLNRRDALWAIKGLRGQDGSRAAVEDLPLFASGRDERFISFQREQEVGLPPMPLGEHVVEDYQSLKLSLKAHPVSFIRPRLAGLGYVPTSGLKDVPDGRMTATSGLILVRQRPGTAKGVIFLTLEDETGTANVIVWPKVFERFRRVLLGSRLIGIKGKLQKEKGVIHLVANRLVDLTGELMDTMTAEPVEGEEGAARQNRTDTARLWQHPRNVSVLPKGRNFH
ncbi:error-prone DNA polymerase [Cucumibacter marinus]